QPEQSGRQAFWAQRSARAGRRSSPARRPARDRRSLHGRRPAGVESRAGCGRGECDCAPLVRQIFRIGRLAARLCHRRPAARSKIAAGRGPWAVSGPAIAVGTQALADTLWIERTCVRLDKSAQRLDAMLADLALPLVGGTSLFRLVQAPAANALFQYLGEAGIWVRAFPENANWLRFGLPGNEAAWKRLKAALVAFW